MKIAALITSFNRKQKTLSCLESLLSIIDNVDVYLVDDGSTDGTAEAVAAKFRGVNILRGDGNLFWSRGMHTAWVEALRGDYDYYLWLNDDVELYGHFWRELMECSVWGGGDSIVSGLVEDGESKEILYGGFDSRKQLISTVQEPQSIKFMNGNVVLVPKAVVDKIGIIDPTFHHDLGDVDYGLRAQAEGIRVISTRVAVAAGHSNNICRVREWGGTLRSRFRRLHSPLGSPPRINFYYRRKHFGVRNALIFNTFLYLINILPDNIVSQLWDDKYRPKIDPNRHKAE